MESAIFKFHSPVMRVPQSKLRRAFLGDTVCLRNYGDMVSVRGTVEFADGATVHLSDCTIKSKSLLKLWYGDHAYSLVNEGDGVTTHIVNYIRKIEEGVKQYGKDSAKFIRNGSFAYGRTACCIVSPKETQWRLIMIEFLKDAKLRSQKNTMGTYIRPGMPCYISADGGFDARLYLFNDALKRRRKGDAMPDLVTKCRPTQELTTRLCFRGGTLLVAPRSEILAWYASLATESGFLYKGKKRFGAFHQICRSGIVFVSFETLEEERRRLSFLLGEQTPRMKEDDVLRHAYDRNGVMWLETEDGWHHQSPLYDKDATPSPLSLTEDGTRTGALDMLHPLEMIHWSRCIVVAPEKNRNAAATLHNITATSRIVFTENPQLQTTVIDPLLTPRRTDGDNNYMEFLNRYMMVVRGTDRFFDSGNFMLHQPPDPTFRSVTLEWSERQRAVAAQMKELDVLDRYKAIGVRREWLSGPCCICLEEPSIPTGLRLCGHVFCFLCLEQWLENKRNCPSCRAAVGRDGIDPVVSLGEHPLFPFLRQLEEDGVPTVVVSNYCPKGANTSIGSLRMGKCSLIWVHPHVIPASMTYCKRVVFPDETVLANVRGKMLKAVIRIGQMDVVELVTVKIK